MPDSLKVLVLGGGPDREREVSLNSAAEVAAALHAAGHATIERDILPGDLSALGEPVDVVCPVLHGPWGEGGPLQAILEQAGLPFVGCGSRAAAIAIDKVATKTAIAGLGVRVAEHQVVGPDEAPAIAPPCVVKPIDDGSSVDVTVCHSEAELAAALKAGRRGRERMMVERFIRGREMTVGLLDGRALPVIEIVPAAAFYDYQAKYARADTQYRFDPDVPASALACMARDAEAVFDAVGCRHLSRVDYIVDAQDQSWFLEINTLPGFTTHSLLPMAARRAGLPMPALCDRLVRLACESPIGR